MLELLSSPPPTSEPPTPGSVLTVVKPDEVIVWLIGQIDVAAGPQLQTIADQAPGYTERLTIDASRVRFCDSTLLGFLSQVARTMTVTVRRPSRIFVDILTLSGLTDRLVVQEVRP